MRSKWESAAFRTVQHKSSYGILRIMQSAIWPCSHVNVTANMLCHTEETSTWHGNLRLKCLFVLCMMADVTAFNKCVLQDIMNFHKQIQRNLRLWRCNIKFKHIQDTDHPFPFIKETHFRNWLTWKYKTYSDNCKCQRPVKEYIFHCMSMYWFTLIYISKIKISSTRVTNFSSDPIQIFIQTVNTYRRGRTVGSTHWW
jgi:hypothetical protein